MQYAWWYGTWLLTVLFLAWCVWTDRTAAVRRRIPAEEGVRGDPDVASRAHCAGQGASRWRAVGGFAGLPAAALWISGLGGYGGLARLILSPPTVGVLVASPVVLVAAFYALSVGKSQRNRRFRTAGWAGLAVAILVLALYPLVSGLA